MPKHNLPRTRGVRFRPDTGWEMYCQDCDNRGGSQTFWPLDDIESWNPKVTLQRCMACHAQKKRTAERERKRAMGLDQIRETNAAYYRENRRILRIKDNERKAARRLQPTA